MKTISKFLFFAFLLFFNSAFADLASDAEKLFSWGEQKYPSYFSIGETEVVTKVLNYKGHDWYYRYYPETKVFLAINELNKVYVLGGVFGRNLLYIGRLEDLLDVPSLAKPSLTTTPTTTQDDSVEVEVNGKIGATVFVNGVDSGKIIDSNGKVKVTLDTSGKVGDKSFSISLKDSAGNESDALIVIIINNTSSPNHVMSFDGTDDYIVTNSPVIAENSKPYTVSVTVTPNELDYGYIISNGGQTGSATGMYITQGVYQNGDNAHFQFGVANESQSFRFVGGNVEVGVETTLTIVYNGNTISIYQDGNLIGTDNIPDAGRNLSMQNLTLGGPSNIPNKYEYKGEIDDVQIYNKALNKNEVNVIKNGNILNNSNLVLHYDFEGTSPLADKSGNGYDATAHGNATIIEQAR